jgi:Ala-tRNA(Pro) deacylase
MASVLEYLQGRGQVFTVIPHPPPVAEGRDHRPRIPGELAAKTIVVLSSDGPVILVIPASRPIDLSLVAEALGDPDVRPAAKHELESRFPDYEPGALPPLSMLLLTPVYVDPAVMERPEIVFAAGRKDLSIRMSTRDLFGSDPIVVTPLTRESRVAPAP